MTLDKKECCKKCGRLTQIEDCNVVICEYENCLCHQPPDKDMKVNPWIKGMEKSTGKSFKSPDTFNTRECINGHKMTGVGFDDCCPECEAPWKDSGGEGLKFEEEFAKIYYR